MKYSSLTGFIYDVGKGVGEFSTDEGKAVFVPQTLAEIVREYVDESYPLDRYLLRRNIKNILKIISLLTAWSMHTRLNTS